MHNFISSFIQFTFMPSANNPKFQILFLHPVSFYINLFRLQRCLANNSKIALDNFFEAEIFVHLISPPLALFFNVHLCLRRFPRRALGKLLRTCHKISVPKTGQDVTHAILQSGAHCTQSSQLILMHKQDL